ncbi:MAG: hypothetical protein U0939_18540 [Pirellulales bacterium]
MKILFLHGWTSRVGGVKPMYLARHGHEVLNPALPDDDFEASVAIAQQLVDEQQSDVVVGSSRGGAVALHLQLPDKSRAVLLCPAWRRWGTATTAGVPTIILHSRADDVVPFVDSQTLVAASKPGLATLWEVGADHRLADPEPLRAMLHACEGRDSAPQRAAPRPAPRSLRRIFGEAFTAADVAEPIIAYDEHVPSSLVQEHLRERDFSVVGVRRHGEVVGYAERDDLGDLPLGSYASPCRPDSIVADATPLFHVVLALRDAPRLFVSSLGSVHGIVTRADLQKAPVRMWLFGFITLLEMRYNDLIRSHFPGGDWLHLVSPARLAKARTLLEERSRRQQNLDLLDCLQFSDKGQIIARHEPARNQTVFQSRRQAEEFVKRLEQLRNTLAHSQDLLAADWDTIVMLSDRLEQTLRTSAT